SRSESRHRPATMGRLVLHHRHSANRRHRNQCYIGHARYLARKSRPRLGRSMSSALPLIPLQSKNKTPKQATLPTALGGQVVPFAVKTSTAQVIVRIYGAASASAELSSNSYTTGLPIDPGHLIVPFASKSDAGTQGFQL